ncbi:SigH putative RNA polymerase sigma factor [Cyanobium sp. PCC 7001]|uniref:sigma-70 family RNA polymerase sigma factor n=1 Tax=Cyanobium sp. PCC 7001 TaxID=180281 RepID=UPI0001804CCE|nr:sigma-70 family RNA polymerase sigma factor [Cyanobium sp. PCC 7001]EDY38767.1 SigH putative RNA polymerase sigma factor [Cyanobium sp. PCC 7001]
MAPLLSRSRRDAHSRDALIRRFLPLADARARRFHHRMPDLLEQDDCIQVARLALVQATARLREERTAPAYLKRCIDGALSHHLRDRALMVRLPARARGHAPWRHLSLDAPATSAHSDSGPAPSWLDCLPAPAPIQPALEPEKPIVQLLKALPQRQAAVLRLTVLDGRSLRQAAEFLGLSPMTVSRDRQRGLERLRQLFLEQPAAPC